MRKISAKSCFYVRYKYSFLCSHVCTLGEAFSGQPFCQDPGKGAQIRMFCPLSTHAPPFSPHILESRPLPRARGYHAAITKAGGHRPGRDHRPPHRPTSPCRSRLGGRGGGRAGKESQGKGREGRGGQRRWRGCRCVRGAGGAQGDGDGDGGDWDGRGLWSAGGSQTPLLAP